MLWQTVQFLVHAGKQMADEDNLRIATAKAVARLMSFA